MVFSNLNGFTFKMLILIYLKIKNLKINYKIWLMDKLFLNQMYLIYSISSSSATLNLITLFSDISICLTKEKTIFLKLDNPLIMNLNFKKEKRNKYWTINQNNISNLLYRNSIKNQEIGNSVIMKNINQNNTRKEKIPIRFMLKNKFPKTNFIKLNNFILYIFFLFRIKW